LILINSRKLQINYPNFQSKDVAKSSVLWETDSSKLLPKTHTHTHRRRRRSSEAQEFFPGRASQGSLYLLPIEFPGNAQEEEEEED
jgi:hypothetical protein